MKKWLLLLLLPIQLRAQIDWKNYSTSFQGNGKEGSHPVLVTAIPYNGLYDGATYFSHTPEKLHLSDSLYPPGEKRPDYIGESTTMDSGNVYFLAPGIHPANAHQYEFRVVLDGKTAMLPWSPITQFVPAGKELNEFLPNYGFLGGYKTTWGHSLLVDIRNKTTNTIESTAIVYWRNAHATLAAVYTTQNLKEFFAGKKEDWEWKPEKSIIRRLEQLQQGNLQLLPGENTLIFLVNASIYQRQAIEYQLIRNGSIDSAWKPNDFDNNTIFLQNLKPGSYQLQLRLRAQRHNPTSYSFEIRPAWYETRLFQFLLGAMQVLSIGAIILAIVLLRQRRKTRREQAAREKLNLQLGYIRSQLNPHFIFNALSSIQGLVNQNEITAANRYLSEFGSLLRDSLAVSDQFFTDLPREMRILDTYLQLEQLRFGFRYSITADPGLPIADTEIPAFLLQPLVENAVKHGVSALREAGLIDIRFSRENANFIASVTDNGKGWDPGAASTGYGLRLTAQRIMLLNQLQPHRHITMTTQSAAATMMTTQSAATGTVPPKSAATATTVQLLFTNWYS